LIVSLSLLIWPTCSQAKALAYGRRFLSRYCGLTVGLDLYESYASVFYSIGEDTSKGVSVGDQTGSYWKLFLPSLRPCYLLFQVSDYPLTHGAALLRRHNLRLYHEFDWHVGRAETNILEMLASGYEEPHAFSVFLGHLAPFWRTDESGTRRQAGYSISGLVGTFGNRHVRQLELLRDRWYEIKWSLKGERGTAQRNLKWNVQFGVKLHDAPGIFDVFFFRLYRDHLDREHRGWSLWKNSSAEYRGQMPLQHLSLGSRMGDLFSLHCVDVGKKFPSRRWRRIAYSVNAGVFWRKYGTGATPHGSRGTPSFFIRPNVRF
jgi:hypothetical protein